jgi:hypothetical protein
MFLFTNKLVHVQKEIHLCFLEEGISSVSTSIDAYVPFYYFIQQRFDKDHTLENLKPPRNTY